MRCVEPYWLADGINDWYPFVCESEWCWWWWWWLLSWWCWLWKWWWWFVRLDAAAWWIFFELLLLEVAKLELVAPPWAKCDLLWLFWLLAKEFGVWPLLLADTDLVPDDMSDAIRRISPVVPAAMAAATSVGVLSVWYCWKCLTSPRSCWYELPQNTHKFFFRCFDSKCLGMWSKRLLSSWKHL